MHVSLAELARTLPDALRGLGLGFPQADRATDSVVWAEAVHGLGLDFLRERGDAIAATADRSLLYGRREAGELEVHELDAAGTSLLESGPRALDLANADAGRWGIGAVALTRTFGLVIAEELVVRSLRRGHDLIICLRSADRPGDDPFDGNGLLAGLADFPADPDPDRPAPRDADALITAFLQRIQTQVDRHAATTLRGVLDDFRTRSPSDAADLLLLSTSSNPVAPATAAPRILTAGGTPGHWLSVRDHQVRFQRSLREGLQVSEADWAALGEFVKRIRVPTSERSRTQAG